MSAANLTPLPCSTPNFGFQDRMPIWSDDFDMDLVRLFPDIVSEPDILAAEQWPLWVYGSTGFRDGVEMFSHPSTWNGLGAPYFSTPRSEFGDGMKANHVDGTAYVTFEKQRCISAWDAARDTWAHHLDVLIDWKRWATPPCYHEVFYPIMAHIRGWTICQDIARLKADARSWAIRTARRAVRIASESNAELSSGSK